MLFIKDYLAARLVKRVMLITGRDLGNNTDLRRVVVICAVRMALPDQ
jgi:hypothetical protein